MFGEVEEELTAVEKPTRFTPPPPTAAYDDSAPAAHAMAAELPSVALSAAPDAAAPDAASADSESQPSPTSADSPTAAADSPKHATEATAEIDEVIALERERLVRERERLQRRRLSRISAPASSVGADALLQLQRQHAQREAANADAQPIWSSVAAVAAGGGLPTRRPSGGGLAWARIGAAGTGGEAPSRLPTVPASPAPTRDAPATVMSPPSPD